MSGKLQPAVVLVADRTLSGNYQVLFEAIFATMQTTQTPGLAMRALLSPRVPVDADGRAASAPLGLRRIEAALLRDAGLAERDVVVATPESLPRLLGPWTRIVAVSSSDPLGRGMSNTTTANFARGQLYTRVWTDALMQRLRAAKDRFKFAIVAGGAGAWQYGREPDAVDRHGIDTVFEGYFESQGPGLFAGLLAGRTPPRHVVETETATGRIARIRRRSLMGTVELSRGCGKGCGFCHVSGLRMEFVPPDDILADIQTNLAAGQRAVTNTSEDFFRYGAAGSTVNFDALHALLTRIREIPGLSFMQIDHGNISSIMQFTDEQLREIRQLLAWNVRTDYLWVNMGVESASGRLVAANSPGKAAPFDPGDWDALVRESADKMQRAGFFPVYSIVLGLPGETPDDVAATRRLVDYLATKQAVVFPIFHEPVRTDRGERFELGALTPAHLELFAACYEINFRRVPALFWDNQRAAGVPWAKRALVQLLGRGEVFIWRRRFEKIRKRMTNDERRMT